MAAARVTREMNFDAKIADLKKEIIETFEELFQTLEKRKQELLSRLSAMQTAHDKNLQIDVAIEELRKVKENAIAAMTNNLLGEDLEPIKSGFDNRMKLKEEMKVPVEDVNFIEFRSLSEQIRKGIAETDLIELIPEYEGRENPILKKCPIGSGNGEFMNPRGVAIDKNTNEVYIADISNRRIQVMSTKGEFLRKFRHDLMLQLHAICLSENELFVTDRQSYLLRFSKSGKLLKKTGSYGTSTECFSDIRGLCCEGGLVYVCDSSLQRIKIYNSDLKFLKKFAYGEISAPSDIKIHSNTIYISSQDQNTIYCYTKECQLINTIPLTGQKVPMTFAAFFVIDTKGNFLISDNSNSEIRIFSPNGVLKHTLGRGHLNILYGIALDNDNAIICVNSGQDNDCFQKY